ncbi:MAG: hypothetical protein HQL69_22450, partial [Magnetococcales bacterium]|nr:hypothetical protein [Magnetococcales bacterium]
RTIRARYPNIVIMMNRGYELLPGIGGVLDMVLGEAVYSRYDFATKEYRLVPEDEYRQQVKILHEARKKFSNLTIHTLDYWQEEDRGVIKSIYEEKSKNGFHPYVSTINLDRIITPPLF